MRRARSATLWSGLLALTACGDPRPPVPAPAGVGLGAALGGDRTAGFARAVAPPDLRFPRDHGPHPDFRTEWWYWTGNLAATAAGAGAGRAFGFELVFFRQALAPAGDGAARPASLAASEVVLAHAALTDVAGERFLFAERLERNDGLRAGVRGGDAGPLELHCADWSAVAEPAGDGLHPVRLQARGQGFWFDLRLVAGKQPVLQGDRGLSQKGRQPGNASIYYSVTRLWVTGEVSLDGAAVPVSGQAWLDREWSTSALEDDQVGWDWFSLQLDDGSELMWYRLRQQDGSESETSSGLLVGADGSTRRLLHGEVTLTPQRTWTAADGAATYPVAWRLSAPQLGLELDVAARVDGQELRTLVRYWEGAVAVTGTRAGDQVAGLGYLEMTGYSQR